MLYSILIPNNDSRFSGKYLDAFFDQTMHSNNPHHEHHFLAHFTDALFYLQLPIHRSRPPI